MSENITDDEQVERLKAWWKENGLAIVLGIVIGLGGVVGVRYWFSYQEQQLSDASDIYTHFITANDKKNIDVMKTDVSSLQSNYDGTSYASLATIALSKYYYQSGNTDEAITQLLWAIENPGYDSNSHFSRVQLVRIYIEKGDYASASAQLATVTDAAFDSRYAEARGDIFAQQGNMQAAAEQYQIALTADSSRSNRKKLVQMKLDNIETSGI